MKIYKRNNKLATKKEVINFIRDQIEDQIEMQQMLDDMFSDDEFYLDYNELLETLK